MKLFNYLIKNYISVLVTLIVLISNPVWFLWNIRFMIVLPLTILLFFILLIRLQNNNSYRVNFFKSIPIFIVFFYYFVLMSTLSAGFQSYLLISSIALLMMPLLSNKEKILSLKFITNSLAVIVIISLIPWLINTFVFPLPMYGYIEYYESKGMDSVIENYIFFIQVKHDFLIRFYSIFDEPGTLGTLSAFVLYGNRYNFRNKSNLIILLGAVCTFSMAFYIIFFIGIIIQNIKNVKALMISSTFLLVTVIAILFIFKDNVTFQTTIVSRFEDINGSMDRRESKYLDEFFESFNNSEFKYFGLGRKYLLDHPVIFKGQTYKFFIIEFGYIGLIIIFLTYMYMIKRIDIFQIGCFIIFVLSFLQRPFIAQPWQIMLFAIIINNLYNIKKDVIRKVR